MAVQLLSELNDSKSWCYDFILLTKSERRCPRIGIRASLHMYLCKKECHCVELVCSYVYYMLFVSVIVNIKRICVKNSRLSRLICLKTLTIVAGIYCRSDQTLLTRRLCRRNIKILVLYGLKTAHDNVCLCIPSRRVLQWN
jgi:hypothetical protein